MSAELSRHRGRPPPPAWKPPPLPDDVESLTSRRSFGSENLSDNKQVKEIENFRASSSNSSKEIVPETSAKKTPSDETVKSVTPSQVKPESKLETLNQKPEFLVRNENKTETKLLQSKNSESNLSSKFPSTAPEKTIFGHQKESSIKSGQEPLVQIRVPIEPSTQSTMTTSTPTPTSRGTTTKPTSNEPLKTPVKIESTQKGESDVGRIPAKSQDGISSIKLKNGNESSKHEGSTSQQEGLTSPKISIENPDSSRQLDDLPKGKPLSRFPPVSGHDEADNSKPKWNSRRSIKSNVPKTQDKTSVQPKTSVNSAVLKPKTVEQKTTETKTVEAKIVESKPSESSKAEPKQNGTHETEEDKENRNHKPATIEELSSAIRMRLKDKSADPLGGLTRLDQCLLLASSTCPIRSMRFSELNVKCLVKTFCSSQEDGFPQDDVETINVVLNPDKVWDADELDRHFDTVADAVNRVGQAGGVALIQATSDNKGGQRPRKLKLNSKASADGADCDSLAGALCVAFFIKHRRLPLESALELIKVRRQDMKPSSALTLQLLEYERKIRGGNDPSSTKTKFQIRKIIRLASQNWIPMTIYFLVVLILAKFIYETIVHMNENDKDSDSEMVCV